MQHCPSCSKPKNASELFVWWQDSTSSIVDKKNPSACSQTSFQPAALHEHLVLHSRPSSLNFER